MFPAGQNPLVVTTRQEASAQAPGVVHVSTAALSASTAALRAAMPIGHSLLDQRGVPRRVQVSPPAVCLKLEAVAAAIVRKSGVQWLVHVADEVHDVLQGLQALLVR